MSMELYNKIQELRAAHDQLRTEHDALRKAHAETTAQLAAVLDERKAHATELRKLAEKVASLWALKDTIAADAKEFLGRRRDPIDPTKVRMPETLRYLGFEQGKR